MSRITDAELDRLRRRIGSSVNPREAPYLTEVTRDAIRHWAWGTGDRNPLYLDKGFAREAEYADVIGPPAMLYAFSRNSVGYRGGLPGVHSVFGGSHWKWHRPLARGMQIETNSVFTRLDEMEGKFAGRMFKQVGTTTFDDAEGPVAQVESWALRFERGAARERNAPPKPASAPVPAEEPTAHRWSSEAIAAVVEAYRSEAQTAGRVPDPAQAPVGTEIPSIVRGPYSSTCAVAFEQAWGGSFIWSHGYWYDFFSRHPGASLRNEEGVPEAAESVHWDARAARRAGVAGSYDFGPERVAWLATLVTNWAGPRGFLSELHCEVRGFNLSGNLTRLSGRITQSDGREGVRLELQAVDDAGKVTASGWARVVFKL